MIGFKPQNLFDVSHTNLVCLIEYLCFIENSERFVLYFLCGWFIGIAVILLTIIIILYLQQRRKNSTDSDDYENSPQDFDYNEILSGTRSILPIYRYDGRTHREFYQV